MAITSHGILATVIGGYVVVKASKQAKAAEVWREEAELKRPEPTGSRRNWRRSRSG